MNLKIRNKTTRLKIQFNWKVLKLLNKCKENFFLTLCQPELIPTPVNIERHFHSSHEASKLMPVDDNAHLSSIGGVKIFLQKKM